MEPDFSFLPSARSDEELMERIDNRQKYLPETIEATVAELQHRGHEFSDEELKIINEDIQAHRENAASITGRLGLFSDEYKNTIVEDPEAPLMYSRRALYVFTVFMGALFGSVLLAINISKTGKRNEAFWVVLFGIGFTALQIFFVSRANAGSQGSYAIVGGFIAAYCLDYIFWRRFIGYSTFYRARAVWMPLIIAVVIATVIIGSAIYGVQ